MLLVLRVADNETGMAHPPGASGGLGLANIEARLAELGGRVAWASVEPQGTSVELRVPLR